MTRELVKGEEGRGEEGEKGCRGETGVKVSWKILRDRTGGTYTRYIYKHSIHISAYT